MLKRGFTALAMILSHVLHFFALFSAPFFVLALHRLTYLGFSIHLQRSCKLHWCSGYKHSFLYLYLHRGTSGYLKTYLYISKCIYIYMSE